MNLWAEKVQIACGTWHPLFSGTHFPAETMRRFMFSCLLLVSAFHLRLFSHHDIHSCLLSVTSSFRAFRINELKTEVTNRLAMLEKRVERRCYRWKGPHKLGVWRVQECSWLAVLFQWRAWRWWRLRGVKMTWRSYEMRWLPEVVAGDGRSKVRCYTSYHSCQHHVKWV